MTESKICTCPSGDGSLVHPCPAHPAVEQADASSCQGTNCGTTTGDHSSECLAEAAAGQGWELKPGDLCGRDCPIHKILVKQAGGDERAEFERAFTVQEGVCFDDKRGEYRSMNLSAIEASDAQDLNLQLQGWQARAALAQTSPAQAEAERPVVVATMYVPNEKVHDDVGFKAFVIVGNCDKEGGEFYDPEKLMTVAQHERIVKAWIERWKAYIELSAKIAAQRDAALARVAELEMLLRKLSTNGLMQFSTVDEEMAVQAALGGAPVSQAQQLHDLDKQCRDDVARALGLRPSQERGFAWSYLLTSIKSCVKASEDSAQAQHSVPEEFIGRLSEFLAQRGTTGKALLRELRAMLAAEPTSSASPSCKWTESSGIWETSCGQTWNFIEDGPAENGALFCHHCGGRLVLIKSDDQEDDGEPCPECLEHGCNGECAGHGAMGD
ncbi:TPA: hypothetical protein ACJX8E_006209 [Pseudomonas aeruginosa]